MAKEEQVLNLRQKLAKIRAAVPALEKTKQGYGYRYVPEEEILAAISGKMQKLGVSLYPVIDPSTMQHEQYHYVKTKFTKDGSPYEEHNNEIIVRSDMTFRWVDDASGEEILIPWAMIGQQGDASQSFGSGLSYSIRYFLLKFFNVATTDDVDAYRSKQKDAEAEAAKAACEAIKDRIEAFVKDYMSRFPDSGPEIRKIVERYVKSGDYNKIKEPTLAAKLLDELQTNLKGA